MKVRPLSGTACLDDALSVEQSKEIFAHFGLAVHASNVLEFAVLNALFTAEVATQIRRFASKQEWESAYDEFFDKGFTQTFGTLVRRLRTCGKFSDDLMDVLDACTRVRNHLVHHSQREGAEAIYSESGRAELIESYQNALALFDTANDQVEREIHLQHLAIGIDTDLFALRIEEEMRKLLPTAVL